jgi:membrane associated rhomboid family serine protease
MEHDRPDPRRQGLVLVGAMAAVMWLSEVVDSIAGGSLDRFGIRPRDIDGLDGVIFAPFLHAGFGHLLANTVPFLLLGAVIALSGLARVAGVTVIVMLVGGLGTWLVGSSGLHIGASGVVFGYAAYLIARFVYSRDLVHLATGAIVAAVWGATLLGGLLPHDGISWSGHLFGAVGGVVAARMLDGRAREKRLRAAGQAAALGG